MILFEVLPLRTCSTCIHWMDFGNNSLNQDGEVIKVCFGNAALPTVEASLRKGSATCGLHSFHPKIEDQ